MPYVTEAEVTYALGASVVLAAYDDDQDGIVDTPPLDAVIARSSSFTDSWIAPVYKGPFPITQSPIPSMLRELTLQYVEAMTFDRRPELVRGAVESNNGTTRWARADEMGKRLQTAVLRIPDLASQTAPANTGGVTFDDGRRIMTTGPDGCSNSGDF